MSGVSVSTYSLREQLGPLRFDITAPDGSEMHIELPYPKDLEMSELPRRLRDEFGVTSIETVAFQFSGPDDPEIDRFASALLTSGVALRNVAIDDGDLLESDPAKRDADIALLKRWIDRWAAMGAEFVRVNPGSAFKPHTGTDLPPHLVAALVELGAYARERGARLLVENHGGPSSDPAWMSRLLEEVGHDNVGLLLDLGNFDVLAAQVGAILMAPDAEAIALMDALDLTDLYVALDALAPRAELVHVKVHHVADDGVIRAVELDRAFSILADHGFSGPVTVEYEGVGGDPWQKTRRVVEATRAVTAKATDSEGGLQ